VTRPVRVLEIRSVRGTGGGPEKTILLGAAQADASVCHVTVCYIRDARDDVFAVDMRASDMPVDYVEIRERNSFDPSVWSSLLRWIDERRIDLVHAHDYKTDLLAWLLHRRGVPVLATAHGWTGHSARERRLYYPADKWLLARLPRVVAVSSEIRDELVRYGADPTRITVVLNAIDHVAYHRDRDREPTARERWNLHRDDLVLGAVGRLEPQKRFDLLIDVFGRIAQEMPHLRLLIAGDGSLRQSLESQIASAGLGEKCRLVGHVTDVPLFHHALDLLVQSSDYEGTPNAVLEAMAFETPLVATRAGGTAELVRDSLDGLLVPTGDPESLERAILKTLRDPESRAKRVGAARARVCSDLSFFARTRRLERIYQDLAPNGRRLSASQTEATCL
jgi:glycosyltransferase involved in cell wall biosynthesis